MTQQVEEFEPWPHFGQEECRAAAEVMASNKVNYWTGPHGRAFEEEFAEYCGTRFAIAVSNGTVALELALRALGVGSGDEVIVTTRTFIASASCIVAAGARPVIVDVDRDSQNITVETIKDHVTPSTKAIIAVHLAGWPCDMDSLLEFGDQHGIAIVEDCAQSHGAMYRGRRVGSMGVAGAFSFCQDKILTTAGEGGMFVTNDEAIWKHAWSFKDHGKCYDTVFNKQHPPGFRWLHKSFGSNYRMTEVQSAVGREILRKLPSWLEARRSNAAAIREVCDSFECLRTPMPPDHIGHAYYKFYTFVEPQKLAAGWTRDRIVNEISATGVPCFTGSCSEIYLEDAFPPEWRPAERLETAKELGETSIMLLVHPTLSPQNVQDTCDVVRAVMSRAMGVHANQAA